MKRRSLFRICPILAPVLMAGGLGAVLPQAPLEAADPFAENVRSTPWLSPEDSQRTFHLPPGFEIQLFAAEPDIAKPMNLAFDNRGRLWVTVTVEYPYPVPLDKTGRDAIKVLEDTDGDGRADRITTFAEGLNIPIGIYPYEGGVVAWSIPNVWRLQDTDGDGRADRQEKLYGAFGWERDTHGMNSSFTRGFDGWLYATHGFNNNSAVQGRDGQQVRMNSGNTYRMRLDGSRIEQFTWGQVNPFGLAFDPRGNLFSADCHSEPLYQLLRGGCYPSFGKPHDGLGFAPSMIFHGHGSTAICGIVYYAGQEWPEEFQNNLLTGNVMTSRVNRDALQFEGSSPIAEARPDFVRTDDPWFRPVNLQLGPDGALYIADFYNRIIGHYEVPLDHPGRDRTSGRIWRVVYRGEQTAGPDLAGLRSEKVTAFNLAESTTPALLAELKHPNLTRRMLAMNELVDRVGPPAIDPIQAMLADRPSAFESVHGLWALHRLDVLEGARLAAAARDAEPLVRTHAMRILSEKSNWSSSNRESARAGLNDPDPQVQRAAADALGRHPSAEDLGPLLAQRYQVPTRDTHLLHTVRMALRDHLQAPEVIDQLPPDLTARDIQTLADTALGATSPSAASFLLDNLQTVANDPSALANCLRHVARYAPSGSTTTLAAFARERFAADLDLQLTLLKSVQEGGAQRGGPLPDAAREWALELAAALFESVQRASVAWTNVLLEGQAEVTVPWDWEQRNLADGTRQAQLLSSFPGGERLTGILCSRPFDIPAHFSFSIAGHSGLPGRDDPMRNFFRLRDAVSGTVLAEVSAPKNDVAQRHTWSLADYAGRQGYLEVVDADTGSAYAWIAFGRFDPAVLPLPGLSPRAVQQRRLAALDLALEFNLRALAGPIRNLFEAGTTDIRSRAGAARALLALGSEADLNRVVERLRDPSEPMILRAALAQALSGSHLAAAREAIFETLTVAPARLQAEIASTMIATAAGLEALLDAIDAETVSPLLLAGLRLADRSLAVGRPALRSRLAELARGLPPPDQQIQQSIERYRARYVVAESSVDRGAAVFQQNCAACHQVSGQGGLVGPQLDGIGARGLERVLEDILDPNRNVDRAFRSHLVILDDDEVLTGLPRREEGELLVLADSTGKEFSVPKNQIREDRESDLSLMPANLGDVIEPSDFDDLIAFLLAQRAAR